MKTPNKLTLETFEKTNEGEDLFNIESIDVFFESIKNEVDKVKDLYNFVDESKVLLFIAEHIFLTDILLEAYHQIHKYFSGSQIVLELDKYGYERIWVRIKTELDADKAFDRLKKLDYNWWIDISPRIEDKMMIDIDFV